MQRTNHSAQGSVAVTTSDTVNIPFPSGTHFTSHIYVGVTGDLKVQMADKTDAVFKAIPVGLYPIAAVKVYATGTTVTNILALY